MKSTPVLVVKNRRILAKHSIKLCRVWLNSTFLQIFKKLNNTSCDCHCSRIAMIMGSKPLRGKIPVILFSKDLRKYWVYNAYTHQCIRVIPKLIFFIPDANFTSIIPFIGCFVLFSPNSPLFLNNYLCIVVTDCGYLFLLCIDGFP